MNSICNMNPVKYMIKDIMNKSAPLDVWLQGRIEKTVGKDIIISDSTGRVKVLGCDFNGEVNGLYCCVIGVAVKTNNIPEIKSSKFIEVQPPHHLSWEMEVKEAQLFLQGKVIPKI